MPPAGDLAHNPGMCPDWESIQRPFSSQASTQSTELNQLGLRYFSTNIFYDNSPLERETRKNKQVGLHKTTKILHGKGNH